MCYPLWATNSYCIRKCGVAVGEPIRRGQRGMIWLGERVWRLASPGGGSGDGTRWEWERIIICTLDLAPNTGKLLANASHARYYHVMSHSSLLLRSKRPIPIPRTQWHGVIPRTVTSGTHPWQIVRLRLGGPESRMGYFRRGVRTRDQPASEERPPSGRCHWSRVLTAGTPGAALCVQPRHVS